MTSTVPYPTNFVRGILKGLGSLVVGLMFVVGPSVLIYSDIKLALFGEEVEGVVIEDFTSLGTKHNKRYGYFRYSTIVGFDSYRYSSDLATAHRKGEKVRLLIDQDDPGKRYRIEASDGFFNASFSYFAIMAIMLTGLFALYKSVAYLYMAFRGNDVRFD